MRTAVVRVLAVVFVFTVTVTAQSADEKAIRARLSAYAQASEKGWTERARFYSDDADLWMSTTGTLAEGKPAMEKQLNQPLPPGLTFTLDVDRVSVLSPEIATVDARYRVTVADQKIAGYVFYVLVKRQGEWWIRSVRVMQTTPPAQ
jgi:uncharacterized protein (TIGR02246 family)